MNAIDDVKAVLKKGERVEKIVFFECILSKLGFIPDNKLNKLMFWQTAQKYMKDWRFSGGFGSQTCYDVYIWTNKRVISVHEYDGSTGLISVPRSPENYDNE